MCKDGRILLAVLTFFVRIKIRVTTFATKHSITDSMQSIAPSLQKIPFPVANSVSRARHRLSRNNKRNDQLSDQFEASR
jgi:hypothetical protein